MVKTPNGAIIWRTYPNGCVACTDENVIGYIPGECKDSVEKPPSNVPNVTEESDRDKREKIEERQDKEKERRSDTIEQQPSNKPPKEPGDKKEKKEEGDREDQPDLRRFIRCTDKDRQARICPQVYDPVCAMIKTPNGAVVWRTFPNYCVACSNINVIGYILGECESSIEKPPSNKPSPEDKRGDKREKPVWGDLLPCPQDLPEICHRMYEPVCAAIKTSKGIEWRTFSNVCFACKHEGVVGYLPGECKDIIKKQHNTTEGEKIWAK